MPGMIHDQSSTGSTLFIEPMTVVKLNNDIKELLLKEQDEIEKDSFRAELNQTAVHIEELEEDFTLLTKLDFIFRQSDAVTPPIRK